MGLGNTKDFSVARAEKEGEWLELKFRCRQGPNHAGACQPCKELKDTSRRMIFSPASVWGILCGVAREEAGSIVRRPLQSPGRR